MFILKQEVSEFIELYAGLKVGQDDNSTLMPSDVELNQVKIPSSISWKSKGYVTSVKNQVCFHCYNMHARNMNACILYVSLNSGFMWLLLFILCYWCSGISIWH